MAQLISYFTWRGCGFQPASCSVLEGSGTWNGSPAGEGHWALQLWFEKEKDWQSQSIKQLALSLFFLILKKIIFDHMAGRVLVPWPGIEPVASAVDAQSLHHWTNREVLVGSHFPEFPSICKETLNRGQHVNLQPSAIPPTKTCFSSQFNAR